MQLSTRYGLLGIGALALLTTVHQLRERTGLWSPLGEYVLGAVPNLAAAIAITFVLLSIWADQKPGASFASLKRRFLVCATTSSLGLLAWEALQKASERFVFDLNDIGATLAGIVGAGLLFFVVTPSAHRNI